MRCDDFLLDVCHTFPDSISSPEFRRCGKSIERQFRFNRACLTGPPSAGRQTSLGNSRDLPPVYQLRLISQNHRRQRYLKKREGWAGTVSLYGLFLWAAEQRRSAWLTAFLIREAYLRLHIIFWMPSEFATGIKGGVSTPNPVCAKHVLPSHFEKLAVTAWLAETSVTVSGLSVVVRKPFVPVHLTKWYPVVWVAVTSVVLPP